jgi:4-hydroxybenzoate polyprenyltransferase
MNKLLLLIKVSRPLGWLVAPLVFLLGLIVSGSISGTTTLIPLAISQILLLSFPYCIFLYGINDVYDYEADQINPKKGKMIGGFIEGAKLEPAYHSYIKRVSFLVISLLLLTSFLTLSVTNVLGMLLLVFFSYFYSAPPLRFKERPPLDSFSNGMLYFFAPFLLGFSFSGSITNNVDVLIGSVLLAVCVMGIHAYSAIGDYTADKKAGLKTFATVFGKRGAALFALLAFVITVFVIKPSPLVKPVTYYYLGFCSVLFFITLVFPSEKPIKWLVGGGVYLGFVIAAIVFLFT